MNSFLKNISILFIGIIISSNLLSYASLWSLKQSNFYKPSFLVNSVAETNFDYIIIGASTGLTTLNTQLIDSLKRTKGINLSIDDTSITSQYLMLQHFLAEGKTTNICVIAPSITSYNEQIENISANDYRFLPYVDRSYVSDYFNSFSGTDAKLLYNSKYLPMLGVSYYNAEVFYPSLLSLLQPDRRNRFDNLGNYTYPIQSITSEIITNRKIINLKFENLALKKIKSLCDKEGIKLICYISPIEKDVVLVMDDDYEIINHSDKLNNTKYFFDDVHVNSRGRKLISEYFANELSHYFNNGEYEIISN